VAAPAYACCGCSSSLLRGQLPQHTGGCGQGSTNSMGHGSCWTCRSGCHTAALWMGVPWGMGQPPGPTACPPLPRGPHVATKEETRAAAESQEPCVSSTPQHHEEPPASAHAQGVAPTHPVHPAGSGWLLLPDAPSGLEREGKGLQGPGMRRRALPGRCSSSPPQRNLPHGGAGSRRSGGWWLRAAAHAHTATGSAPVRATAVRSSRPQTAAAPRR
jgi:hypothetical protein